MSKPNILHIFTDQQRVDSIRALGGWRGLQTPNIDRLCREGTVFSSAYTPVAECVPARACMITGMYADRISCRSNAEEMPPEATPTLMSGLRDAGYRTHGVGKCHFTPDPWASRGFETRDTMEELTKMEDLAKDDYLGFLAERGFDHVIEPHGIRGEMYYIPQPSQLPEELHPTRWVGDCCLSFIEKQKRREGPWYLYAGFIHPHPPFAPPNPWHKLYRAADMELPHIPKNFDDLLCYINRFQNRYKYRDRGIDLNLVRCMRAYYAACVSFIDFQVGRILRALERSGELDNTMVVFTADHGELLGDFGSFGKRSFHDASQKIPLIIRQPGRFQSGSVCKAPASLVDLLPTFFNGAGIPVPEEAEGMDVAALAGGCVRHSPVYFHYEKGSNAIHGIVDENWKYAWSAPDNQGYLFARDDVPESKNCIDEAGVAGVAAVRLDEILRTRAAQNPDRDDVLDSAGRWRRHKRKRISSNPDAGILFQDPLHCRPEVPEPYYLDIRQSEI
jgi:arylsulfatase A-like enzyme